MQSTWGASEAQGLMSSKQSSKSYFVPQLKSPFLAKEGGHNWFLWRKKSFRFPSRIYIQLWKQLAAFLESCYSSLHIGCFSRCWSTEMWKPVDLNEIKQWLFSRLEVNFYKILMSWTFIEILNFYKIILRMIKSSKQYLPHLRRQNYYYQEPLDHWIAPRTDFPLSVSLWPNFPLVQRIIFYGYRFVHEFYFVSYFLHRYHHQNNKASLIQIR